MTAVVAVTVLSISTLIATAFAITYWRAWRELNAFLTDKWADDLPAEDKTISISTQDSSVRILDKYNSHEMEAESDAIGEPNPIRIPSTR